METIMATIRYGTAFLYFAAIAPCCAWAAPSEQNEADALKYRYE